MIGYKYRKTVAEKSIRSTSLPFRAQNVFWMESNDKSLSPSIARFIWAAISKQIALPTTTRSSSFFCATSAETEPS